MVYGGVTGHLWQLLEVPPGHLADDRGLDLQLGLFILDSLGGAQQRRSGHAQRLHRAIQPTGKAGPKRERAAGSPPTLVTLTGELSRAERLPLPGHGWQLGAGSDQRPSLVRSN